MRALTSRRRTRVERLQRKVPAGKAALPWQHLQGPLPVETLMVHEAEAAALMTVGGVHVDAEAEEGEGVAV